MRTQCAQESVNGKQLWTEVVLCCKKIKVKSNMMYNNNKNKNNKSLYMSIYTFELRSYPALILLLQKMSNLQAQNLKAFQLWPHLWLSLSTSREGPPISSPAPAAEGHKTAGNGSLSAALDASTGGMPRADGQLSRPARSTRKAEVRSRQVQKLLEEPSRRSDPP